MRSEKGNILIVIVIVIVALIIGWILIFKGNLSLFNFNQPPATPTKRQGEAIDLTNKPAEAKYLPDFINHCQNTPGYRWTGEECVRE
ncbi:hypothetical protein HYS94_01410 [Candidatus Daviesbacteria bacterium]|nr:hypothetical protein [Candidatus Daviesbacteria bacterium]